MHYTTDLDTLRPRVLAARQQHGFPHINSNLRISHVTHCLLKQFSQVIFPSQCSKIKNTSPRAGTGVDGVGGVQKSVRQSL